MKQLISFGLATILSFFLFILMYSLINGEVKAIDGKPTPPISINVDIIDKPLAPKKTDKLPEPEKIKPAPDKPKTSVQRVKMKPIKVALATGTMTGFTQGLRNDISLDNVLGTALSTDHNGTSALTPKVRIEPMYPQVAARDGVQGFVTLSFDINSQGDPINVQVIKAEPRGYFERSAKKAVRKWKYSPQKEEGVSVAVFDQQITLKFNLEDN